MSSRRATRPVAAGALGVAALGAAVALQAVYACAGSTPTASGGGGVDKELVAEGLDAPIYTAAAPGVSDLVYVVERGGTVQAVDPSDGSATEFLDISSRVTTAGEGGLLSIAFDPDYQSNDLLYAYYTTDSSHTIEIDEFTAASDTNGNEGSRREVLTVPHPGAQNHQGGTIAFGPDDRLYAATGDGGDGGDPDESAQDKGEPTGKLLRIDPHGAGDGDYTVPMSNPYVGKPGLDEIYALGLRNPFRFAFDPVTGRIGIGDVGQDTREEVDIENEHSLRRANFGWDHFEGDRPLDYPGDNEAPRPRHHYEPPVLDYSHDRGDVVTGGLIVRDASLPTLEGRYLYADYSANWLRSFKPKLSGAKGDRKLGVTIDHPTSVTAGPGGKVYATAIVEGKLFRLVP